MNNPLFARQCNTSPHDILIDLVRLLAREAARADFSSKTSLQAEE